MIHLDILPVDVARFIEYRNDGVSVIFINHRTDPTQRPGQIRRCRARTFERVQILSYRVTPVCVLRIVLPHRQHRSIGGGNADRRCTPDHHIPYRVRYFLNGLKREIGLFSGEFALIEQYAAALTPGDRA